MGCGLGISFLEAVRAIPILPTRYWRFFLSSVVGFLFSEYFDFLGMIEVCTCRKIYGAVFDIWRKDAGDLEAVMACYQILNDLGKVFVFVLCETAHFPLYYDFFDFLVQRYPRTCLSDSDKKASFGEGGKEVVVDKEVSAYL